MWNANGVGRQRNGVEEFLERHNVDVLLVGETHLAEADTFKVRNYITYRNDRDATIRSGGTAVLIKRCIEHAQLCDLRTTGGLESTSVVVTTANMGPIQLSAVYKPPSAPLDTAQLDTLLHSGLPVIIAGDLNAKHPLWHSRTTNKAGRALEAHAVRVGADVIGPNRPTRHNVATGTGDVLDIAIIKDVTATVDLWPLHELDSDHLPVLIQLNDSSVPAAPPRRSAVDWEAYSAEVEATITVAPPLHDAAALDAAVISLTGCLRAAIDGAARPLRHRPDTTMLPQHIRANIREKNRARKRWQQFNDPEDRATMNRLRLLVRSQLREHRNDRWEDFVDSLADDERAFWRVARALRSRTAQMPALQTPTVTAHTAAERCEVMAEHYREQFTPIPAETAEQLEFVASVEAETELGLRRPCDQDIPFTTPEEVRTILSGLKRRKAPGVDNIPNKALKILGRRGTVALTNIFNAAIRLQHFPLSWKMATIIAIRKPGKNPALPASYRPISLLPTAGKVLERLLLTRLHDALEEREVIPPEQFGFRRGHSTVDQLLRVVERVAHGFTRSRCTAALFLDVSQAFDRVWHGGLLHKMLQSGVPTWMCRMVASFLKDRTFRVKIDAAISGERSVEASVPQGSVLGPTLFNIYTADAPRSSHVMTATFADDQALLASSYFPRIAVRKLQSHTDALCDWYSRWRIRINATKSTAVLFAKRRLQQPGGAVRISGDDVPWSIRAKYLGVVLDRKLSWTPHVKQTAMKARQALGCLTPLLGRRSRLNIRAKLKMFKSVLRPIMTYASPVWGNTCTTNIRRLQTIQNIALRRVTGSPWFVRGSIIHNDISVPYLADYLKEMACNFFARCALHSSPLVRACCQYDEGDPSNDFRPRAALNV